MESEQVEEILREAQRVYNSGGSYGGMSGLQAWQRTYKNINGELEVIEEIVNYVARKNSNPHNRVFVFGDDLSREILKVLSGK